MRVVIAPQEFKGSLTASEAASVMGSAVRAVRPDAQVVLVPVSDGGPGLVDALLAARGGERVRTRVHDALMRPIDAEWALLGETAAIEMAAASGLVLVPPAERDALTATTYGTGELVRAALDRSCHEIIVGVGGSATTDAGAGAMQALGARLVDTDGGELPSGGAALARLERIDLSARDARLSGVRLRVATDVWNPLCGEHGAAAVYAPQKGASPDDVPLLDAALRRFGSIVARDLGIDVTSVPGTGAAGGLGAGLMVLGATIEPGFALVAEAAGLDETIASADIVLTGEGRLDAQTAYGKTAGGVAKMARAHGKRVIAVAGSVDASYDASRGEFDVIESLLQPGMRVEQAMADAPTLLRAATERALRRLPG